MFSFGHQRVILPRQESAALVRTLIVAIAVPVAKGIYIIVALLIIVLICKGMCDVFRSHAIQYSTACTLRQNVIKTVCIHSIIRE